MRLHLWQIQPLRDVLVLAAIFGVLYIGYILSIVTVPMLLALTLAYLFEPVVARAARTKYISRPGAAMGIIVIAGVVVIAPLVVGLGFAGVQGVQFAQRIATKVELVYESTRRPASEELREEVPEGAWREIRDFIVEQEGLRRAVIRGLSGSAASGEGTREATTTENPALEREPAAPIGAPPGAAQATPAGDGAAPSADGAAGGADDEEMRRWAWVEKLLASARANADDLSKRVLLAGGGAIAALVALVGSVGKLAFGAFLTAFFFYFFCTGYGKVLEFWEGLIPERKRARTVELLKKMDAVIAGFVRGRLTVCAILMVYFVVAYWLIGVPAALLVGLIVGALTLVPYISGLGVPVTMLLLWLEPSDGFRSAWWWVVGAPIVVYMIAQFLDDYVLTPQIQGKSTNMDVPTILFASLAGGVLAGFYGVLLAIPVAACIKILLNDVFWPRFRAWSQGRASDFLPIEKE